LIIGSGPIIIGQACEFDYSGTQACKALREEGYRVVLVNSNPATIMTDPEFADRTYVEPVTPETIDKILAREKALGTPVDAILPTLGGQTGLNCAVRAADLGILEKHGVELIAATRDVIHKAESRVEFKKAMQSIGLDMPCSGIARTYEEAIKVLEEVKLPCVIRPAFTLGGSGSGLPCTMEEFEEIAKRGLELSPVSEILIEESLMGWKEYELEVMRDRKDNVVIICSIENFDPMGVHTGDSITVAPAQTLTDKEYQRMRDASLAIIREIGVETGGSNIQFAVHPETGRMIVIEMNPRVSRSSALASKATGFPIAKIAAKLAVGYTLDEIRNDITRETPASFEPTIDYCVVKIPRWAFEKFPEADETLTTQMKSVGEAMSIGRTFKEALQKGIRSMEIKRFGLGLDGNDKYLETVRAGKASGPVATVPEWVTDHVQLGVDHTAKAPVLKGRRHGEGLHDWKENAAQLWPIPLDVLADKLARPCQGRPYYIRYAFKQGWSVEQVYSITSIDPWFLQNMKDLVDFEEQLLSFDFQRACDAMMKAGATGSSSGAMAALSAAMPSAIPATGATPAPSAGVSVVDEPPSGPAADLVRLLTHAKGWGYSDIQLATAFKTSPMTIRNLRKALGVLPVYKLVDTCAAEFEAYTPYFYSTYESPMTVLEDVPDPSGNGSPRTIKRRVYDDEIRIIDKPTIIILGGGPNRIGQGIEFDYCCVHAVMAAQASGHAAIMVNSNPETVSTDYDTADLLFFEPLTIEDVLNICERYQQAGVLKGVIVQFGGQTPLNLAQGLKDAGVPIIGTSPESIHLAEDRKAFNQLIVELGLQQPAGDIAYDLDEAKVVAARLGYPVLVRPSYVLGGRAMEVCNNETDLVRYMKKAMEATDRSAVTGKKNPILIDKFLMIATEVDVDAVCDGKTCVVAGVMEHIEEAGIHSGDSACALPPYSLSPATIDEIKRQTKELALKIGVRGLMNVQYAVKDGQVYILEVNPRASRTVPFVSKATGVPWAKVGTRVMLGESLDKILAEFGLTDTPRPEHTSVKEAVFPFNKFPGVDVVLGPEMRSTGEVMGIDREFGLAYAKAQIAGGGSLPTTGTVFISVNDADKPLIAPIARQLADLGFNIIATGGTHKVIADAGVPVQLIPKINEGKRPNMLDMIIARTVQLLINTPTSKGKNTDEGRIRAGATIHNVPIVTTVTGARAALAAIRALRQGDWDVRALQDYFPKYAT
jgi:carbamoyl-phosphate synthase large subunit